jgi:transcription initiation factor TFIIIB Brf1 subunit/transcription initiation factor TFIIB
MACWNCGSDRIIVRPDEGMLGLTDEIVCVDCGETQEDEPPC